MGKGSSVGEKVCLHFEPRIAPSVWSCNFRNVNWFEPRSYNTPVNRYSISGCKVQNFQEFTPIFTGIHEESENFPKFLIEKSILYILFTDSFATKSWSPKIWEGWGWQMPPWSPGSYAYENSNSQKWTSECPWSLCYRELVDVTLERLDGINPVSARTVDLISSGSIWLSFRTAAFLATASNPLKTTTTLNKEVHRLVGLCKMRQG